MAPDQCNDNKAQKLNTLKVLVADDDPPSRVLLNAEQQDIYHC